MARLARDSSRLGSSAGDVARGYVPSNSLGLSGNSEDGE
jgi:hypothetical protein